MGKGGILEIEREGVVDDTPVPAGAVAQPSAPQVSSSQACMISSWRPNPSGGTAIRTRTGYAVLPRAEPAPPLGSQAISEFPVRSNDIPEKESCREAHPNLAARPRGANIGTNDLAADGERRGGESAPEARGMKRPAPLPQRMAAASNILAPARRD
jgi:hypothetical protein